MEKSTIFYNNKTQSVRLPAAVRFDAHIKKVLVRVEGHERIITPAEHSWDRFFLDTPTVSDDFMVERDKGVQPERDTF